MSTDWQAVTSDQARWTLDGEYFEERRRADPIGPGLENKIRPAVFPAGLHEQGDTRIIPLDLSEELRCTGPATSPTLCANFIRINPGDEIRTQPNATSELYFVIRGNGQTRINRDVLPWARGDIFVLPARTEGRHCAESDAALYWVHDWPLLRYLGANAVTPRFRATLYPRARTEAELKILEKNPEAVRRNRAGVLLANKGFPRTRSATHVIGSMFGILPAGSMQLPDRNESAVLALIVGCAPGCYTLIGRDIDDRGNIVAPNHADWEPGAAFVMPPGLWHSHHNETDAPAYLLPIQDAGLHNYLRTLGQAISS
jgi:gentisate 1,2-dioxygenase